MAKLFGFEVVIDSSLKKGEVVFLNDKEIHLAYIDWKVLSGGAISGFNKQADDIYLNIANKFGLFKAGKFDQPRRDITLPDIEFNDFATDYIYSKICESCSDKKMCKRISNLGARVREFGPEQLFIDEKQLEEKTKFVCQYCFNYLKQTGVF